jgi:5'-nucleotidase
LAFLASPARKNDFGAALCLGLTLYHDRDWPSNCQHLPPSDILTPSTVAKQVAKHLRTTMKCDFVIALTHMRLTEDLGASSATQSGEEKIDLLLGGHDHHVVRRFAGDTEENPDIIQQGCLNDEMICNGEVLEASGDIRIVKSGTNWSGFSVIRLHVNRGLDGIASLKSVKRMS